MQEDAAGKNWRNAKKAKKAKKAEMRKGGDRPAGVGEWVREQEQGRHGNRTTNDNLIGAIVQKPGHGRDVRGEKARGD